MMGLQANKVSKSIRLIDFVQVKWEKGPRKEEVPIREHNLQHIFLICLVDLVLQEDTVRIETTHRRHRMDGTIEHCEAK